MCIMLLKKHRKYKKIGAKSNREFDGFQRIIRLLFWQLLIVNLII
ncbi:hypothetical protein FLJC2902T_13930 [Flavobacterium limnosediminis JC2902]|uniref:Uncharacterized protein n=1 Tax=Flavobacterium limnosediminis JC2902 TaxID=1341181 RepID=V6SQ96_9FLAO|nr:hypothetical protein FLJC2902T_13930 [Flavobacterium limnosediminis JC2902]